MNLAVRILRSEAGVSGPPEFQAYSVPLPGGEQWTAMDVLDYIHSRLDPSLAYFRHSNCDRGLCRRCAARINGRTGLLCGHLVTAEKTLVLEPASRRHVVKDLVCRVDRAFDKDRPSE